MGKNNFSASDALFQRHCLSPLSLTVDLNIVEHHPHSTELIEGRDYPLRCLSGTKASRLYYEYVGNWKPGALRNFLGCDISCTPNIEQSSFHYVILSARSSRCSYT